MKTTAESLINDLIRKTEENLNRAEELKQLSIEQLNWRESAQSWSILECLEHLNLYGDYYLPEIKKTIKKYSNTKPATVFHSGLIGNWFAEMMRPKERLKKMKTFKDKDPLGSELTAAVIDRFLSQQLELIELLESARRVNIGRAKTAISITPLLKLKLGDTFRFVIYHNQRHMVQAMRAKINYDKERQVIKIPV